LKPTVRNGATVWFTTTRARVLICEPTFSLVEEKARRGNMPPLHVHHDHDEIFHVLSGRLSVHTAGTQVEIEAGQAAFAPRRVPHTRRVESEVARWLVATNSGGYAAFVSEVAIPARGSGYAQADEVPPTAELAAAAASAGIEVLGPPGALP
jgi:mannose-6-phosphate isomerase-like protein (cupin superfamily)